MARPKNVNATVIIQITTTAQLADKVDALVRAGLYGRTRGEVCERALCERLRTLIKEGFISVKEKTEI